MPRSHLTGVGCSSRRRKIQESLYVGVAVQVGNIFFVTFQRSTPAAGTAETGSLMHANRSATSTGPFGLFLTKKLTQADVSDSPKIFDHAHAVLCAITLIQMSQSPAREVGAVAAKLSTTRSAILDFAAGTGGKFRFILGSAARTAISCAQEGVAKAAIHSARGNKFRFGQAAGSRFLCHHLASKYELPDPNFNGKYCADFSRSGRVTRAAFA